MAARSEASALLTLLLWPSVALGATDGVPRPEGWIGTAEQWTQGLGIALSLLPLAVIFLGHTQGFSGMETVRACGGCHAMTGHVKDLTDLQSESLAAVHFKNRYI